jgi:hypothetical protein
LHCVVAWDVRTTGAQAEVIDESLASALKGFSWTRPLPTTYVIKIQSAEDLTRLREQLLIVCREHTSSIHLLISPPMTGGSYQGWLPRDTWPKIEERTK